MHDIINKRLVRVSLILMENKYNLFSVQGSGMANCGWLKYILLIIILCFFSPMYIISDNILNCIKVLLFNKCLSAVNNVQEWTSHHSLCKLYTHNTNGRILNFDDYLTMYTLAIKDILLGSLHGVVESIRYFVMSFKVYLIYR